MYSILTYYTHKNLLYILYLGAETLGLRLRLIPT